MSLESLHTLFSSLNVTFNCVLCKIYASQLLKIFNKNLELILKRER